MTAEILCVGTELLLGNVTNTNATFLSEKLSELGINVYRHTVVGDNSSRLEDALKSALSRSDIIVMTGGLGPTYDDMTKETAAAVMGLEMEFHEGILEGIKSRFSGGAFPKNNERQAYFPKGATIIQNDWGTAPSCMIEKEGKSVIMLPGVPSEMKNIWNSYVTPLLAKMQDAVLVSRYCRIVGIGESALEERLYDLLKESINPTVAPYASSGECMLRVTARAETKEIAYDMTVPVVEKIRAELGDMLYGVDVENLEGVIVSMLSEANLKVSLCESCTGGMIASRITSVSGSSGVFECGIVSYSNGIKEGVVGVSHDTLGRHSAYSAATAIEMAEGVLRLSGSDISLSVTGIMGPNDLPEGEVGTVFCAVSGPIGTRVFELPKRRYADRETLRRLTTSRALDKLRLYLLDVMRGVK